MRTIVVQEESQVIHMYSHAFMTLLAPTVYRHAHSAETGPWNSRQAVCKVMMHPKRFITRMVLHHRHVIEAGFSLFSTTCVCSHTYTRTRTYTYTRTPTPMSQSLLTITPTPKPTFMATHTRKLYPGPPSCPHPHPPPPTGTSIRSATHQSRFNKVREVLAPRAQTRPHSICETQTKWRSCTAWTSSMMKCIPPTGFSAITVADVINATCVSNAFLPGHSRNGMPQVCEHVPCHAMEVLVVQVPAGVYM